MNMASAMGRTELVKGYYRDFSEIYAAQDKWKQSAEAFRKYVSIKDSLSNEDKSKEVGRLEARAV